MHSEVVWCLPPLAHGPVRPFQHYTVLQCMVVGSRSTLLVLCHDPLPGPFATTIIHASRLICPCRRCLVEK